MIYKTCDIRNLNFIIKYYEDEEDQVKTTTASPNLTTVTTTQGSSSEPSTRQQQQSPTIHYVLTQPPTVATSFGKKKSVSSYSPTDPSTISKSQELIYQIDPRYDTISYSIGNQKKRNEDRNGTIIENKNPKNIYDTISFSAGDATPSHQSSKPYPRPVQNYELSNIQYEGNSEHQSNVRNNVKSNSIVVLQNPSGQTYNLGQNLAVNQRPQTIHPNDHPQVQQNRPVQIIPFSQKDPNYLNTAIGAISAHILTNNVPNSYDYQNTNQYHRFPVVNNRQPYISYQRPQSGDYIPFPPNGNSNVHNSSPNHHYFIGTENQAPIHTGYSSPPIPSRRPSYVIQNSYGGNPLAGAYARANSAGYGTYSTAGAHTISGPPQSEYHFDINSHNPRSLYRSNVGHYSGHFNGFSHQSSEFGSQNENPLGNIGGDLWEINQTFLSQIMPHLRPDPAGNSGHTYNFIEKRRDYVSNTETQSQTPIPAETNLDRTTNNEEKVIGTNNMTTKPIKRDSNNTNVDEPTIK